MRPVPCARITGSTAHAAQDAEQIDVDDDAMSSHAASSIFARFPSPAFAMSPSTRPNFDTAASTAARTWAASVTSAADREIGHVTDLVDASGQVGADDQRAVDAEASRDRMSDAGRRAGDEDDLALDGHTLDPCT